MFAVLFVNRLFNYESLTFHNNCWLFFTAVMVEIANFFFGNSVTLFEYIVWVNVTFGTLLYLFLIH